MPSKLYILYYIYFPLSFKRTGVEHIHVSEKTINGLAEANNNIWYVPLARVK